MERHLHIHVHVENASENITKFIRKELAALKAAIHQEGLRMSQELDDLTAEVAATRGVMESAVLLIEGFDQRLADAGTDPAMLASLRTDLQQGKMRLASAVADNQPPMP